MGVLWIILTLGLMQVVMSEDVTFESGISVTVVDPASIENPEEFADPKNTGSKLFDANVNNYDKKRLALAVTIKRFRSESSNLFRAHPVFINCLQLIMNTLQNMDTPLMMASGYKTKTDTKGSDSLVDLYARSGAGAVLAYRPQVSGNPDILKIARVALKFCPPLFDAIQRDIGIIMMSKSVGIFMTGEDDPQPHFSSDGFTMDTAAFKDWALTTLDEGQDPTQKPDCSKFDGLDDGQTFPSDVTKPEEVVGDIDTPVTRDRLPDFKRLIQYPGKNIEFPNPERTAAWCGLEGNPCVDCRMSTAGNAVNKRCANRLMTTRMHNFLRRLQKLTRDNISGNKLKVMKAFDEPYEGNSGYSETSLHVEGRQVVLELNNDNTAANRKIVTKYAQCIGVDYVKHDGSQVILAVRKMKGKTAQKVNFQGIVDLIAVDPPFDKEEDYKIPDDEVEDHPLFDSSGQLETPLAENAPLSLFVSDDPEFRYLRIHPLIAKCYSLILFKHNKFNADGEPETGIDVVQGYISTKQQSLLIDTADQRYNTLIYGIGMEIRYGNNPKNLTIATDLIKNAIAMCAPIFDTEGNQQMGIGVYKDKLFLDMRDAFEVWTDDIANLANYSSLEEYQDEMAAINKAAIEYRIVDPDDLEEAKTSADRPSMQSITYQHQTPPSVVRRRRAAPSPDDCVPTSDTKFCEKSKKYREEQVEKIWEQLERKWHYRPKQDVRDALENCLLSCGTCTTGAIFENKLEHCDNFLHWVPFRLMNEDTITHIFPRDDSMLRRYARQGHNIEDPELFHLVVNALESKFRPNPEMSVEEELYPETNNPSPIMSLLHRLYGIHAAGKARVFVRDNTDLSSLSDVLKVLMLYNKNITEVTFHVANPGSQDAVESALQNLFRDWSTTAYPAVSREYIAPYTIEGLPELKTKRDVDTSIGRDLIEHHRSWESRWINMEL